MSNPRYAQVELAHGGRANSSSIPNSFGGGGGGGRRGGVSRHTEYRGMPKYLILILVAQIFHLYKQIN
jgi:hypothetical protein